MSSHPSFRYSSTILAVVMAALLTVALLLFGLEIYGLAHDKTMQPSFSAFILALISFICVGLFFVSFYINKRMNTITATAERIIATGDVSQRIPIGSRWQDLSKLSTVLNAMLEEIDRHVTGMRQVLDNIAHDLRTPLTRLRNHIETMRDTETDISSADQQEQLSGLIAECDGLLSTFNALLRIANIESGRRHAVFERVNLAPVIEDVIDLYEPIASENNINLAFRIEPAFVMGDKDLLFQAIANLLDNAVKHTPPEGAVILTLSATATGAKIVLSDTGPGIEDIHKPHVFRRFYRVAACRSTPGSGLGLSLVAAIVHLHQGSIALSDNTPHGLIVTVLI